MQVAVELRGPYQSIPYQSYRLDSLFMSYLHMETKIECNNSTGVGVKAKNVIHIACSVHLFATFAFFNRKRLCVFTDIALFPQRVRHIAILLIFSSFFSFFLLFDLVWLWTLPSLSPIFFFSTL